MSDCFHCGLPANATFSSTIDGRECQFCCPACQAVAQAIAGGGLADFYHFRDAKNVKAESTPRDFQTYDLPEVHINFVDELASGESEARFTVRGISCAACAWLIEKGVAQIPGVSEVRVNATDYRCRVRWNKQEVPLSRIMQRLSALGYAPEPFIESEAQNQRRKAQRASVMRLGLAGFGMMQVGMFAIALHAGALQGMESSWRDFLRAVSLVVATPVVLYAAFPFFRNAWRSLRHGRLVMDVPVALAIGLAYIASFWATLSRSGEVYFDSIAMFTFFLLLGRYLEMRIRHSSAFASDKLSQLLPTVVQRVENGVSVSVPLAAISEGDKLSVQPGEVIPADAVVVEGTSSVDESLLSGESRPVMKSMNDHVFAGTLNGDTQLTINTTAVGRQTYLSAVERMVENAALHKPHLVSLADRVASVFVLFVLFAAAAIGAYWYWAAPERAVWIVLSVLVATCPCALSLATPAALTAGITALRRIGVWVVASTFIEKLQRIDTVVLDKTGTLTEGKLRLHGVIPLTKMSSEQNVDEQHIVALAAALESHSKHPIASAFAKGSTDVHAENVRVVSGCGVEGDIDGCCYRFGKPDYAAPTGGWTYPGDGMWQLLSRDGVPWAWLCFRDRPRHGVEAMVRFLKQRGLAVEILSGDRPENVDVFARELQVQATASATPEKKLQHVRDLQDAGKRVLMLGDGINDVPVLKASDLSLAVGSATRLAQIHADAVLASDSLTVIEKMFLLAARVRKKIKQNLAWAAFYNASILPLAAMGLVPPYIAALGMSLSSLFVVVNALSIRAEDNSADYDSPRFATSGSVQ